jgi:hypothetical protein
LGFLEKVTQEEMEQWFEERTTMHIDLVRKWLRVIAQLKLPGVNGNVLKEEEAHDEGKWVEPEYTPYVHLTWKYRQTRLGNIDYQIPSSIKKATEEATWHHISTHQHHPEYWDPSATPLTLNTRDRDTPSGNLVDATRMPLSYIASMMADWLAMSEEKGTDVKDWIRKNVNVRWKFGDEQVKLIIEIAERFGGLLDANH